MPDDRYAKFDYSRMISWDERLKREWPLLEEVLRTAPSRQVLDLGSGSGEHARFIGSKGFDVIGIDSSPAMLEKAVASTHAANVSFVAGDIREADAAISAPAGAAICLGNALPHLDREDDLNRMAAGLRKALLPDAPVLIQLLNYDRIEAKKERALPLAFLPDQDDPLASILFLRAVDMQAHGRAVFMPTILRVRSDRESPIELLASQRVEIRTWRATEIEQTFREAGFPSIQVWGSYQKTAFERAESRDVIFLAR